MRILVFSGSHKDTSACAKVVRNIVGTDMIIHAGDHASDAKELEKLFPEIPVRFVSGNCDLGGIPSELVFEAGGRSFFLTHGHNYRVKYESDYYTLISHTRSLKCNCAIFGHTHVPYNRNFGDIVAINPGSIKYGRTYGVIEIENGFVKSAICDASYII